MLNFSHVHVQKLLEGELSMNLFFDNKIGIRELCMLKFSLAEYDVIRKNNEFFLDSMDVHA